MIVSNCNSLIVHFNNGFTDVCVGSGTTIIVTAEVHRSQETPAGTDDEETGLYQAVIDTFIQKVETRSSSKITFLPVQNTPVHM